MWALELIDSWGKLPSGMFWGHLTELGNFDECLNFTKTFSDENQKTIMKGQYCLVKIPIDNLFVQTIKNPILRIIPSPTDIGMLLRVGICAPDSCKVEQITKIINNFTMMNFNKTILIGKDDCTTYNDLELRTIDIISITIFSIIGVVILLSTIYDYLNSVMGGHKHQLFISFSLITNGKKLFKLNCKSSPDVIECLNGIRTLSIMWVVYGHVHMAAYLPMINAKYVYNWLQTLQSMIIQNATVSVDTFFLLSGLLVAWVVLKELDKSNGKLNIPLMYFHRYLRLTPVLGFSILFSITIFQYLGNGPFWKNTFNTMIIPACEKYWWSTLLYIQNYVNPNEMCVPHSWYLSADTQLYLISPLLLIPLWRWGIKFIWVPILLALGSISATFAITYKNNFSLLYVDLENFIDQKKMTMIYYVTHTRLSPWIVGILLGFYLHLNKNQSIKLSKLIVLLGWICSFIIMLAVVFGYYHRLPPNPRATKLETSFYESCSRVSWSIAISWIIFACHKGYGGIINEFLSLKFWQPFSKLSYCIYITHMFVQTYMTAIAKTDIHFSTFEIITSFYANIGVTLVVSVICVLAFESPIIGIEKWILGRSKESSSKQSNSISQDSLCHSNNENKC